MCTELMLSPLGLQVRTGWGDTQGPTSQRKGTGLRSSQQGRRTNSSVGETEAPRFSVATYATQVTLFQPLLQLVMGAASGHIPEEKLVALYLLSPFPWLGMGAARWPGPGCPCTEEPVAAPDGPGGGTAHWVEPVVPAQQML